MDINAEINALKILLRDTDYKALKHADGALTDAEYEPIRAQRAAWRAKINELEAQMPEDAEEEYLEAQIPADTEEEYAEE